MAEENSESLTAPVTPTPAAEPKKQRAPRRSKEQIAAELAAKQAAKGGPKKKEAPSASASARAVKSAPVPKKSEAPKAVSAAKTASKTAALASDEFADLLALEEENRKLRKALADKLRAENVDLKKKLGVS
ncbi:hypothetical protein [Rhizobium sp. S163]|uniref:hypothetical protein n=1 Tax=Rhizobium sp. S163 TaxID=3055039 RepID=UPI0025AA1FCE|nr:hypothetical protein [Rhizobium sp. S163]MDM9648351.1 hypothetical protein [Rhizobium sp. S163]